MKGVQYEEVSNDAEDDPAMRIKGLCFRFSLHKEYPRLTSIIAQNGLEKQFQQPICQKRSKGFA